ncbi:MAG: SH3 domain-containing protein [Clostridia bacterium]|nr:SH3 domain-containing protein [Clostridia bacterium]
MKRCRFLLPLILLLLLPLPATQAYDEDMAATGYIYAPRTGKASLRRTASKTAAVLHTFHGGEIVEVLEDETFDFSHVRYEGTTGWVLKGCVSMLNDRPVATGVLTGGADAIPLYGSPNPQPDSIAAAQWAPGMAVQVYPADWEYYEGKMAPVAADGLFGYVSAENVSMGIWETQGSYENSRYKAAAHLYQKNEKEVEIAVAHRAVEIAEPLPTDISAYQVYANQRLLDTACPRLESRPFYSSHFSCTLTMPEGADVIGLIPLYPDGPHAAEAIILRLGQQ